MAGNNLRTPHGARGRLGPYDLFDTLGSGGFGKVYLGEHIWLHSKVAVKVLHEDLVDEQAELFKHEAETVAQLPPHPYVVRVLDYNVQDGRPYIVMDYAPNGNLRQRHSFGIAVPLPRVVSYVRQIASGLQHVHNFGVVHCDVKPENMFIGRRGEIQIGDFGIAVGLQEEDAQSEDTFGTVSYMAPEQILSSPLPASDQYALGVVVFELLTGQLPFTGENRFEIANKQLYDQPLSMRALNSAIPEAVELVVMKALDKDPGKRYPTITAFAQALEVASRPERPISTQVPAIANRAVRSAPRSHRHRPVLSILSIIFIAFIIFGFLALNLLLTPEATVTIAETGLIQSWGDDMSSVIGSTDTILNPIAAHTLTVETAPQTKTVPTKGTQTDPATQAQGEVTFYNSDVVAHFIPAGATIAVPNSTLQVATNEDVTVPAGVPPQEGQASVQAHIVQTGADGNIAAGALFGSICCSNENIHVNNLNAFSGGQDSHTYSVVQQSDIDGAATSLEGLLQQSAPGLLQQRAQQNELLVNASVHCTPNVSSEAAVGSKATTVTVIVKSTCTGTLYNQDLVHTHEFSRFTDRENQTIGAMFALDGNIRTNVTMAEVMHASKNQDRLVLHIVATGVWRFNFTMKEKQRLLQAIAGKTISEAYTQLMQTIYKSGVNKIMIRFSWNHPGFAEDRLPEDTGRILLEVVRQ